MENMNNKKMFPDNLEISAADMGLIGKKKAELEALASSQQGMEVKEMLGGEEAVLAMLEKGDIESLKSTLSQVIKTKPGAELMQRLSELMK